MTRRIAALAITACFAVVVTPATARQKIKIVSTPTFDQHSVGGSFDRPVKHDAKRAIRRTRGKPAQRFAVRVASVNRNCLAPDTTALLVRLEARFGRVQLVKTCVPGARMPSGQLSWHAKNKAFDFDVPPGVDKRDVMVWLDKNSPGVTISYLSMPRTIHTDTGSFHKVIYNAASHEAGERAVAIWQQRERDAAMLASLPPVPMPTPLPKPRPSIDAAPIIVASLGEFDSFYKEPVPLRPEPISPEDRIGIFRRYAESVTREIVVLPHVTFSCPGGNPVPRSLLTMLSDAARHFDSTAIVNSAYRSKQYNEALRRRGIRAAKNSWHIKCEALDWRLLGVSVSDLKRYVVANTKRWGIGGLGTYGTFLHTDVRPLAKAQKLVTWTGGHKRYAKRKHQRYAAAG